MGTGWPCTSPRNLPCKTPTMRCGWLSEEFLGVFVRITILFSSAEVYKLPQARRRNGRQTLILELG